MRKLFVRIENALHGMCGRMTPQRRIIAVAILLVVFAAVNIWMTFSAVYSIGREPHENHQNYFIPLKIEDNDTTESEL